MKRLPLYLRTVAGLRPVQWAYFPLRRVQSRWGGRPRSPGPWSIRQPSPGLIDAPSDEELSEVVARADRVVHGHFHFLSHEERFETPAWNRRHVSRLWNYHFHYFDYARDLAWAYRQTGDGRYPAAFASLALSWIRETDGGIGDGWDPYPTSVRLVNWIHAVQLFGEGLGERNRAALARSIAVQSAWLERRLERHIQANHLQKNFTALAWAGLFLAGSDAERWRTIGLDGAWWCAREHILADGAHYERSPMYHAIALCDWLELLVACRGAGVPVPADVRIRLSRMLDAMGVLSRPDGRLHLFNDAAHGIALPRHHLNVLADEGLGERIPEIEGILELATAGYYGYAAANADRLVVDCGIPGPRHQPGHAHCDLLSFELDVAGEPVVVDSGVHGYDDDPLREYARSTRAHNTIMIGDREQSEIWGTFRVARMAKAGPATAGVEDGQYWFRGSYAPYYDGGVRHERDIRYHPGRLDVVDRIYGAENATFRSYLHLSPRFRVQEWEGMGLVLLGGSRRVHVRWSGVQNVRVGSGAGDPEGWYLPEFGRAAPALVMVGEGRASDGHPFGYEIRWT